MAWDEKYLKGIECFNKRDFFDAHEIWEDLWHQEKGEAHNFLQGLIQFATALHHFKNRNLKGTKTLYEGGAALLAPYGEVYWGLPLKKLRDDMARCVQGILNYSQEDLPGRYDPKKNEFPVVLDESLIPQINLQSNDSGGSHGRS